MGKLVHLTNVFLDLLIEDEHRSLAWGCETGPELAAQSDLNADFAGIWAAATRRTSR